VKKIFSRCKAAIGIHLSNNTEGRDFSDFQNYCALRLHVWHKRKVWQNMKTIGFIDYYLDEWHANNYPKMIGELSNHELEVAFAWAKKDAPGGLTNSQWSAQYGVPLAATEEELIEKCDYFIVLSPDNPEMHEELCRQALRSGKRTFIDKTFAPTKAAAEKIFEMAEAGKTPMYSASALRFSKQLENVSSDGIDFISSRGPGSFDTYLIHQVEPIVSLMGSDVRRVMYCGTGTTPGLVLRFGDEREAVLSMFGWDCPFNLAIGYDSRKTVIIPECTEYFEAFLKNLIGFFLTGAGKIPAAETIAIMGVLEKAHSAAEKPGIWVEI
jgi:hypothetical protein